ncbi:MULTISPECIES: hypothetical protein [Natrinema]|uniref:Uncharacterized protein n=1 Tax=Natrinema gari JCM 14663 TaxID=1230459 RepID=L9YXB3_9EURY|nr:hypothetical protein NJ7G_3872 [Natrinema sp. J7-2]ELY77523.1 hypothetical protein C486_15504 [Natrinema gari JCM 14663]
MPIQRRMQFVHGQIAWMIATVLVLTLLNALSYELVFVLSLIGFLIITELTAPFNVTPTWRRRLRWLILLGLAGFAVIVVRRILDILPPEVIPA